MIMSEPLEILYADDWLVAVNKPSGIHVHPTDLSPGERTCLEDLRDQLGRYVWPVHRLDRATSGVQVFALDQATMARMSEIFRDRAVHKIYWAVVRGYLPDEGRIEHPLQNRSKTKTREAETAFRCLARAEIPEPVGDFETARYSLAEANPLTGRRHQLRRHFRHIAHPIIGDTTYGDSRHNIFFRKHFHSHRLLLMAVSVTFRHPYTDDTLRLLAVPPADVRDVFTAFGWPIRPESDEGGAAATPPAPGETS
jgi:tRNA pseudouridine65 synthase